MTFIEERSFRTDWCCGTLPPSCAVVMKSGNLNFLEPSGPLQACNGTDWFCGWETLSNKNANWQWIYVL